MFFNNFDYYKYKDKVDFCSIEQNVEGFLFGWRFRAESSCENASTDVLWLKVVNMYPSQYITESKWAYKQ
jgi:hypothetical protein